MKSILKAILLSTLAGVIGCERKAPSASEAEPPPTQSVASESPPEKDSTTAIDAVLKQSLGQADYTKSIEAIRIEASTMDLKQLMETAQRYKSALAEKQEAVKAMTEELSRIPMAQRLSPEAQKLAGTLKELAEPVKALTERLAVYVEAIKAHGGDATGLMP